MGGREATSRDALDWCREAVERGAGELLITSVDRDGTLLGYDLELIAAVRAACPAAVITASGGLGTPGDAVAGLRAGADAVAVGAFLHRGGRVAEIKAALAEAGVEVRCGA